MTSLKVCQHQPSSQRVSAFFPTLVLTEKDQASLISANGSITKDMARVYCVTIEKNGSTEALLRTIRLMGSANIRGRVETHTSDGSTPRHIKRALVATHGPLPGQSTKVSGKTTRKQG